MLIIILLNILFLTSSDSLLLKDREISGFSNTVSVTTDGKGFLYALDNESNEIIKMNDELIEIKRTGRKGWNTGEFDSPTYIDGSSGLDIFVTDGNNYRIQRFDLNLGYIASLYTNSETFIPEYKFNRPLATIIVYSNDLFVIDGDNNRIVTYPRGLEPATAFGDFRAGRGSLMEPIKILKDSENFLYVLDKKRDAIMKYDNFGNFIRTIKGNDIATISLYEGVLYILSGDEILLYDLDKNAYIGKKVFEDAINTKNITDLLVYSKEKYLVLMKNKLILYKSQN